MTIQQIKDFVSKNTLRRGQYIYFVFDNYHGQFYGHNTVILRFVKVAKNTYGHEYVKVEYKYGTAMREGNLEGTAMERIVEMRVGNNAFIEKFQRVRADKSPNTRAKHVGVEIELISKLTRAEIETAICNADLEKYVQVKDDCSISTKGDYCHAHELCILGTERNVYKIVNKVYTILKDTCKVNSSCGLHVHLDMRHRDVQQAYANLYAAQPLLFAMVSKSRVESSYCDPIEDYSRFDVDYYEDEDREYTGINRCAYGKYRTLEIRIHSGTFNSHKINNWIRLLVKIVNRANVEVSDAKPFTSLKEAVQKLKLNGRLGKYVQERTTKFNKNRTDLRNLFGYDAAA
jgi:hypothetical protein